MRAETANFPGTAGKAPQRHPRRQQALPWGFVLLHKRTRAQKNPRAARFLPPPLNGQLGWDWRVALQLGQASDYEGKTAKVRDRAQLKAQLEVLQPGTVGMSGFHPAQQCHEHNSSHSSAPGTHTTSTKPLGPSASGSSCHFGHKWHTQGQENWASTGI